MILSYKYDTFIVKFSEDKEDLKEETMKPVLTCFDQALRYGKIGFIVNEMNGFYVENFQAKTEKCQNENELTSTIYFPPQCNRFKENYIGKMALRFLKKKITFN